MAIAHLRQAPRCSNWHFVTCSNIRILYEDLLQQLKNGAGESLGVDADRMRKFRAFANLQPKRLTVCRQRECQALFRLGPERNRLSGRKEGRRPSEETYSIPRQRTLAHAGIVNEHQCSVHPQHLPDTSSSICTSYPSLFVYRWMR